MKAIIKRILKFLVSFAVIYRMKDDNIYLTFDDGPHPIYTPQILDVLKREQVKATFFVVGCNSNKYPEIIQRIVHEGHTLGYHTKNHKRLKNISLTELFLELKVMKDGLENKKRFNYFRPPYGELTIIAILLCFFYKIKIVQWSFDSKDSFFSTKDEVVDHIFNTCFAPGDILLFHDDEEHTAVILAKVIKRLRGQKFNCKGLSVHNI